MDVKALQRHLRDFAVARDWQTHHVPKNLTMALVAEAADLMELFQWTTLTESRGFTRDAQAKERVTDGIAGALLRLLQLADHTDVDVEQAAASKLRKWGEKHPARHPEPPPAVQPSTVPRVHLLVDWENVQPSGDALRELVSQGTDVWLFHGPQQKVDTSSHVQVYGEDRITQIPRSGTGKNALDFQLTYYVGYISARQPDAAFVVVSNDTGYDPMLAHACELGFDARRCEYRKPTKSPSPIPSPLPPVKPAPLVDAVVAPKKASVQSAEASAKATRQEVLQFAQQLQTMAPAQRPAHKNVLLALLQSHLEEPSMQSPRVAHALAQLRAQKHVLLKGDGVSYLPSPSATPVPAKAALVKAVPSKVASKAPAKKAALPPAIPKAAVPEKKVQPPTAAQVALRVLASLRKMPDNKPTRRAGLLKLVETHTAMAADPKAMAQQVCALLEVRKDVVPSPDGKGIVYPKIDMKKAAGA